MSFPDFHLYVESIIQEDLENQELVSWHEASQDSETPCAE